MNIFILNKGRLVRYTFLPLVRLWLFYQAHRLRMGRLFFNIMKRIDLIEQRVWLQEAPQKKGSEKNSRLNPQIGLFGKGLLVILHRVAADRLGVSIGNTRQHKNNRDQYGHQHYVYFQRHGAIIPVLS